jgi:RNA polymerase sigma factor (sigma-70 family)
LLTHAANLGEDTLDHAPRTDEDLFERWRADRDHSAFALLESRYRNELLGYARSRLARMGALDTGGRAQEHVQETFLRLSLRTTSLPCVRNWVYRVLANLLTDEARKLGSGPLVLSIHEPAGEESTTCEPADDDLGVLDELINSESPADLVQFWQCVQDLPDHAWRLLVMHYVSGHSYEGIGRLTGLKYSQVSMRLHEARQRLRKCYQRRLSQPESRTKR